MAKTEEVVVKLRVTLLKPPKGVQFCLQRGKEELLTPKISKGSDITFDLDVRAQEGADGAARLLGPFTQGPVTGRFFYICVGTYAGQMGSPWARRIKVPLTGIAWGLAQKGSLQAAFEGTAKDGSPACATVKLTDGWHV